jgi:hypothetical protein
MLNYDPNVLGQYAERKYAQANRIVAVSALVAAILGGGGGFVVGLVEVNGSLASDLPMILGGVGLVLALPIGLIVGAERAFMYKFEAQRVLCEMRIEINTRNPLG